MIELVNTSLPNGLLPGTHGFSTVGMTRGTPDAVRTLLEGLSSYVHRASGHDERYRTENPVAWHHVAPPRGGHVLSRVAACEFDYTGRTNRLARHWQADGAEWPSGCNAARALLANRAWFEAPWKGAARWFEAADAGRLASGCGGSGGGAPHWVAAYGAQGAGWAAGLVRELRRQAMAGTDGRTLVIVTGPSWDPDGTKLLGLFADLIDGLPERERGRATFSTYAAVLPGWVPCALRGYLADDPALGVLTKGRPWFDAKAGVLHGAELLPAEGGEAAMEVWSGMGTGAGGVRVGSVGAAGTRGTTGSAGMGTRRKKAEAGAREKAFFAGGGVALVAVLGFLVWMLAGGKPKVEAEAEGLVDGELVESVVEVVAEGEAVENVTPVEEAGPEVAVEDARKEPPDSAVKMEKVPSGEPRLVEGGVWRRDKPLPGEAGVRVMYYRDKNGTWVEADAESFSFQGAMRWRKVEFWRLCLWVDGNKGVFWEFAEPAVDVDLNWSQKSDWRPFWLGPEKRVWSEWAEETKTLGWTAIFRANVFFRGTTYSAESAVAPGVTPLSVQKLRDLAGGKWAQAVEEQRKAIENELKALDARIKQLEEGKGTEKSGERPEPLQREHEAHVATPHDKEETNRLVMIGQFNAESRKFELELENEKEQKRLAEESEPMRLQLEEQRKAKQAELEKLPDTSEGGKGMETFRKEGRMRVELSVEVGKGE